MSEKKANAYAIGKAVKHFCFSPTGEYIYCTKCIVEVTRMTQRSLQRWRSNFNRVPKRFKYEGKVRLQRIFKAFVNENRVHNGRTKAKTKYWLHPTICCIKKKKRGTNTDKPDSLEEQFNLFLSNCYNQGM